MSTRPNGKKTRRQFLCLDCGVDTGRINEYYMVIERVWWAVHDSGIGMLCIGCLETRLGRRLRPDDFTDAYVNDVGFAPKSQRLMARLTR